MSLERWKFHILCVFVIFGCCVAQERTQNETNKVEKVQKRMQRQIMVNNEVPNRVVGGIEPTFEELKKMLMYPYYLEEQIDEMGTRFLHEVHLPFLLPFFGFQYSYIWISVNGYITFGFADGALQLPAKFPMPRDKQDARDPALIAPFLTNQDINTVEFPKIKNPGIYFSHIDLKKTKNETLRRRVINDFQTGMVSSTMFNPTNVLVITWKNMTIPGWRNSENPLSNTYQVVIATDQRLTYTMFNYEQIAWYAHADTFEGMSGNPPFVGFNGGNFTRAYHFWPYSQSQRVATLPYNGYGNNLNGRYFFRIDEEVWSGACVQRELDPSRKERPRLTFFPRYGHMLGGTMVNVTGDCVFPGDHVTCRFETREVPGIRVDNNVVMCISPPIMFHGYIDLSINVNKQGYYFLGRFYIQPPEIAFENVMVMNNKEMEEVLPHPGIFNITWKPTHLTLRKTARVYISIWGYRESQQYPSLTFIDHLTSGSGFSAEAVPNDLGYYYIEYPHEFFKDRDNSDLLDMTFGFIAINLTDSDLKYYGPDVHDSPILWSRPIPLGWYFKPQWERKHGKNYKEKMCNRWYDKEWNSDRFAMSVWRCPCTMDQADHDRGKFAPDLQCNVLHHRCEPFYKGALHCTISGQPAIGGAGQICCYDERKELLRTGDTVYSGRPSRSYIFGKHPFNQQMMVPSLSYWTHDVMPFFFCCKWAKGEENAETCDKFKFWRTSQDCSTYQTPGVGTVYGDPHIMTFDGQNYTFNGKGEFVLTKVDSAVGKLEVQGRFEQVEKKDKRQPPILGTRLTAVVAQDNHSSIVEVRLRPKAATWLYQLFVIVDKEYVIFWDDSLQLQTFKGVTIYQPAVIQNMSHIVAMFASGAGLEVMADDNHMVANIYLPKTFRNQTRGLLGNWSNDLQDEFTDPDGRWISVNQRPEEFDRQFGKKWRVDQTNDPRKGRSLFWHDVVSFEFFDEPEFRPEYDPRIWPNYTFDETDIREICSESPHCRYDFITTRDPNFAKYTRTHEAKAHQLKDIVTKPEKRCPSLARPRNGQKTDNKYFPGSIVRFKCDEGYRLIGYEVRRCDDMGLWSWGVEAECVSDKTYNLQITGMALGIALPMLVLIILLIAFLIMKFRRSDNLNTSKQSFYFQKVNQTPSTEPHVKVTKTGSDAVNETVT